MKRALLIFLIVISLDAAAQTEDERHLTTKTYLLSQAVFGTKDSILLDRLFAKKLTYGHSKGKTETRSEAIRNIINNASTYKDTVVGDISIIQNGKTAIVRHSFVAKEIKPDGSIVPLNLKIMLVWVKQDKHWRLMGRQAIALPN
jgi:ketosteroid isomerase-like protein